MITMRGEENKATLGNEDSEKKMYDGNSTQKVQNK